MLQSVKECQRRKIIDTTAKFILTYYSEDISLQQISDYVGLSPNYLSNAFKKSTGNTPMDYLTKVRMIKAKELLLFTNLKINDIASKVGYNSPQNFLVDCKIKLDR